MLTFLRVLWFRVTSRFRREALDTELAEELRVHRELLEDEARRDGLGDDAARHAAAIRLGNGTVIRERARDGWSFGWLEAVLQDTRYAGRFLRRSPGFTVIAVLSLALGIGANAAVFTVVDRLLLREPPHVRDAGDWHTINVQRNRPDMPDRPFHGTVWFPEIFALQREAKTIDAVVAWTPPSRVRLGKGPDAPRIKESTVSDNYFDALGVRPAAGRFFDAQDLRPDAIEPAAVISYGFWQRQFGGAPSAVGTHLMTSGLESVVIGVAPAGFTGFEIDAADVWMPFVTASPFRIGADWQEWTGNVPRAAVRLRDGVHPAAANAEATLILRRRPDVPRYGPVQETVRLGPVIAARGPAEQTAEVKVSTRLVLASLLVLLAACANLANLLLVRALSRRREIALRLAVGISRRRLVAQLALESLLIALLGAGGALLAARWGGGALRTLVFPELQWASGALDMRVLLFSLACAVSVALVATIAPAVRMTRADVAHALRSASPQLAMSTGRLRQGLLILQVALSVMLIVGATAFGQSLRHAYAFDMGVDLDRVILTRLFTEGDSLEGSARRDMLDEAGRRAARVAGVERVTFAERVPLVGNTVSRFFLPSGDSTVAVSWGVTPDLIAAVGFRLVRGRWILPGDVQGEGSPALVTEAMARAIAPSGDAVGQCVRSGSATAPCRTIVGVVRDLRTMSIREEPARAILLATAAPDLSQSLSSYLVVRTTGDAAPLVPRLRDQFRDLRPDLTNIEIRTYEESLDRDYRPLRLGTAMFGAFALLAVFLAGVGLFGILAFSVAQRTSEIGIRAALGATRGALVRHVMGEGMLLAALGILLGGGVSWYAGKAVEALLFDMAVRSVPPFAAAAGVLGLVAVAASALPAWRASRVDPAIALRAE